MERKTGYFDRTGSPVVHVEIGGIYPNSYRSFEAIIDTGYNGFISLPLARALPLGLVLIGTITSKMADGYSSLKFTAEARIKLGTEEYSGPAVLEPSSEETLLGLDFLAKAKMKVVVDPVAEQVYMESSG